MRDKLAQEEMVGFAVIVVIVGVILLILLSFLIKTPDQTIVQDSEIESFIESSLQYTTDCDSQIGFLPVQELIISCENGDICIDGRDSCDVLKSNLGNMVTKGWNVGTQSAVKGYEFKITADEQEKIKFQGGNKTASYQGAFQDFTRGGTDYQVSLNLYS
ncbi:Uncharacterised protein [uncultured archaeon]|nr:Uncharacterised protein [uncultured archaeon]